MDRLKVLAEQIASDAAEEGFVSFRQSKDLASLIKKHLVNNKQLEDAQRREELYRVLGELKEL